jgi:hypothetical protein
MMHLVSTNMRVCVNRFACRVERCLRPGVFVVKRTDSPCIFQANLAQIIYKNARPCTYEELVYRVLHQEVLVEVGDYCLQKCEYTNCTLRYPPDAEIREHETEIHEDEIGCTHMLVLADVRRLPRSRLTV